VVWIREFLLGRTQRVRVGGKLSAEVRVTSGAPQGSVLGPKINLSYCALMMDEKTVRNVYSVVPK
jgi:hypothetical protein